MIVTYSRYRRHNRNRDYCRCESRDVSASLFVVVIRREDTSWESLMDPFSIEQNAGGRSHETRGIINLLGTERKYEEGLLLNF